MVKKYPRISLLNFRNADHSTENSRKFQEQSGMKRKLPGKNFSKIWVYLARLTSLTEILENAVPFATGSCRKFKADLLVE